MHTQLHKQAFAGWLSATLVLMLLIAGCSGKTATGNTPLPPAGQELPAGMGAQLPALPPPVPLGERAGSAIRTSYISGIGLYQGEGYGTAGNSLTLPAQPNQVAWAMYVGSSVGDDIDRLELDIEALTGEIWVAISDYGLGRWRFLGTLNAPGGFDPPDGDYTKGGGGFYLLLITWDGDNAKHNYTVARYDDGDPQGPVISGHIEDENGDPLGGALVYSTPGFHEAYTDMQGNYALSIPADGDYTLTPEKSGFTFTPVSTPVTVAGADVTGIDFDGASLDVRGVIMENGQPLGGVKLTLSTGPVITSLADGSFEFQGLGPGMVTIVPKLAGYSFNPASINADVIATDINDANFTATGGQATFVISGRVTDLGTSAGLAGASVQLLPDYEYAQTDANGDYSFTGLAPDIYKVKAFNQGYTITPVEIDAPVVNQSITNANFDAQPLFKIEGKLMGGGGTYPLANVTVKLMPGNLSVTTNSQGGYSFGNRAPGNYTVTPESVFYTFAPLNRAVVIAGSNMTVDDFDGTLDGPVTYTNYIANSVSTSCLGCHTNTAQNDVLPYLRNYSEVNAAGALSNVRVQNNSMPPGNPLSAQSKALWSKWANDGRPQ